jgi:MerR family transcriptional regulator/heat shock protein HspR
MRSAARLYHLHEVLETVGISRRTLRMYEEVGLVTRVEADEQTPIYAEEALETIRRIQRLRSDLGVNLAGVQVILEMRRKIEELQQSLEEVVRFVQIDLREELETYLRRRERAIVPRPLTRPPTPKED